MLTRRPWRKEKGSMKGGLMRVAVHECIMFVMYVCVYTHTHTTSQCCEFLVLMNVMLCKKIRLYIQCTGKLHSSSNYITTVFACS